jgi:uncharacterized caspase-like protein
MFPVRFVRTFAVPCLALFALIVIAQDLRAAGDNKRLALVIGNSAYREVAPLTNPVNDAADVAKKLKSLGFDVLLATNADLEKMVDMLDQFGSRLTREHVGLIFYAGHGITINNQSFLVPIDAPAEIEVDEKGELTMQRLNAHLISIGSMLAPLETSRVGIVFLDACRTNAAQAGEGVRLRVVSLGTKRALPIMRGTGSVEVKPSPYSAGVFRAYATQLDNVASDGNGRNSPFTKALLAHIETKGITIQEMMIRVRKSVMQDTKNQQVPWEEAALNDSFYFVTPSATLPMGVGPKAPASGPGGGGAAAPARPGNNLPPNIGFGVGGGL